MLLLDEGLARALRQHQYSGAVLSIIDPTSNDKGDTYECELLTLCVQGVHEKEKPCAHAHEVPKNVTGHTTCTV